jgi:hypothetical protein
VNFLITSGKSLDWKLLRIASAAIADRLRAGLTAKWAFSHSGLGEITQASVAISAQATAGPEMEFARGIPVSDIPQGPCLTRQYACHVGT